MAARDPRRHGTTAGRLDYTRDPRTIPLHVHAQIQLDVGTPLVAPRSIVFPAAF